MTGKSPGSVSCFYSFDHNGSALGLTGTQYNLPRPGRCYVYHPRLLLGHMEVTTTEVTLAPTRHRHPHVWQKSSRRAQRITLAVSERGELGGAIPYSLTDRLVRPFQPSKTVTHYHAW